MTFRKACAPIAAMVLCLGITHTSAAEPTYHSAWSAAYSPDGARLAVTDHTAGGVAVIDAAGGKVVQRVALRGEPTDVVWSADGTKLYVSELQAGSVAEIDARSGAVERRLEVGPWPMGLALARQSNRLVVCDAARDEVLFVDLATGETAGRAAALRQPFAVALTPDESLAVVSNLLPDGAATEPTQAAGVSIIEAKTAQRVADVRLPAGSSAVRGVVCSADGAWAYVVHTLGRVNLPTTQLERGWVNTNALSVIDLKAKAVHATLLLDHPMQGSADPWGVAIAPDGSRLWVTLAGVHRLASIDLARLPSLFDEGRAELVNDLAALRRNDLIEMIDLPGRGPRGLSIAPDGKTLAAALYFDGQVALIDAASGKVGPTIALGKQPAATVQRQGEQIFYDATYCFQTWLSCATCHPDSRVDGLNWDLLNDGLGNPKNARSLLWSDRTPPVMSLGVRDDMETAVEAGFRHIQFRVVDEATLDAVRAYLRSLEPVASPHLENGKLSAAAQRGKALFESKEVGCASCHLAPLYTDLKQHNVGTRAALDRNDAFDTPTLVETWRTGPYLHSGAAPTLRDVLTTHNAQNRHGRTAELTPQQIDDLVAYLKSL